MKKLSKKCMACRLWTPLMLDIIKNRKRLLNNLAEDVGLFAGKRGLTVHPTAIDELIGFIRNWKGK